MNYPPHFAKINNLFYEMVQIDYFSCFFNTFLSSNFNISL